MLVNSKCFCNNWLYSRELIVLLLPCNHYVHEKCINKELLNNNKKCPICNTDIDKILTEEKIKKSNNKQNIIDLRSIKYFSDDLVLDYTKYPSYIIKFNMIINKMLIMKTKEDILNTAELFLKMTNIKINIKDNTKKNKIKYENKEIKWINKKDNECKKIIISNHCCFIDSFILYYLFQCGFISSSTIKTLELGKIISEKCNLLLFDRKDNSGTVDKIKKYLDINKKIIIFPQGAISYGNTLSNFRTGAFYSCDTICPVSIKFTPEISEPNMNDYYFKLFSQDKINVEVTINDFEVGPFNDNQIQKIRKKMAKQLKFDLSNLSTKGLKD